MPCIKLTDQDGRTRPGHPEETQWGPGVHHEAEGPLKLCENGLHYYPEGLAVAILCNPGDANLANPRAWRCVPDGEVLEGDLKACARGLTTVEEAVLPVVTTEQRIEVAIRCALVVCDEPGFRRWAEGWLSGADRTAEAAEEAWAAAWAAAAWAAAEAAWAAWAAAAAEEAWAAKAAGAAALAGADVAAIAESVFYRGETTSGKEITRE